jgi:PAS domain S-box-containing protein
MTLLIVLVVVLAQILVSVLGLRMATETTPMLTANMTAQHHLGVFHLWLEARFHNDTGHADAEILQRLDLARQQLMLISERIATGTPYLASRPQLTLEVTTIIQQLARLKTLAATRLKGDHHALAVTQVYDRLLQQTLRDLLTLEETLAKQMEHAAFYLRAWSHGLSSAVALIALLMGLAFVRHEVNKQRDFNRLQEEKERLRSVTESVKDGIIAVTTSGLIVFWNRAARHLFGFEEHEIMGKPFTLLIPERYKQVHLRFFNVIRQGNETTLEGDRMVHLFGLHKDGSEFPLEFSLAPWTRHGKQHFLAVVRKDKP